MARSPYISRFWPHLTQTKYLPLFAGGEASYSGCLSRSVSFVSVIEVSCRELTHCKTQIPHMPLQRRHSTMLDPIESFLENSHYHTPNGSIHDVDIQSERSVEARYTSEVQLHYRYLVKYLPILIIFTPAILTIFFPKVIQIGPFKIGDPENEPSDIVIGLLSILILCWIVKFLLDWPWKWYIQINDLKLKLNTILESNTDDQVKKATHESLKILNWQHVVSLSLCIMNPFICWLILFISRDHITVGSLDTKRQILSDLNIGVFVSCGLLRVVIQISEHVQKSTASIESKAEKLIHGSVSQEQTFLELDGTNEIITRLEKIENQISDTRTKVDLIYSKNKLTIENDMTFLTSKHFKILEKEINELNFKLNTKSLEFDEFLRSDTLEDLEKTSSLHGVSISKHPSYIQDDNGPKYPIEQYSKALSQTPWMKLSQMFPILEPFIQNTNDFDEHTLNELTLNTDNPLDQLIWLFLGIPLVIHRSIWAVISFIPTRLLKVFYLIVLNILDLLLDMTKKEKEDHIRVEAIAE